MGMHRDTGSSQTLMQRSILPLESDSYNGNQDVLITGIEGEYLNSSIQRRHVRSDLGDVVVGA